MNECKKCNGLGKFEICNLETKCDRCDGSGFDTSYKDEIICPYCGYEHSDSWEYNAGMEGDFEMECDDCGKEFTANTYTTIAYSSWRND